jgi:hypothetical protein
MTSPNLNIVTNLITFLGSKTPVVRGQRQADSLYSDLPNAFNSVPHKPLMHKLSSFEFSGSYCSLYCSYLTKNEFGFGLPGFPPNRFK